MKLDYRSQVYIRFACFVMKLFSYSYNYEIKQFNISGVVIDSSTLRQHSFFLPPEPRLVVATEIARGRSSEPFHRGEQRSFFCRNVGQVTPKIIYLYYLFFIFIGSKHPKNN